VKIKSQRDFWSALLFIVAGLAFAAGATHYSFGSSARPGPAYFPFGLGILLALLGALILFRSLSVEAEGGDPVGAFAWKPLGLIVLSVVVFGAALPRLGLFLALPILILISSLAGDEFKLRDVVVNSLVLTIGSWAVFVKGLDLVIPLWPAFVAG
jgi:hypothetical protein